MRVPDFVKYDGLKSVNRRGVCSCVDFQRPLILLVGIALFNLLECCSNIRYHV